MKVTHNWLAEFVEMNMPLPQLAERLTMAGLEVESTEEIGRELSDVRCAEIIRVEAHPNAERLVVCEVRTGADRVRVVCGATNMKAGDRVAYAAPGCVLPADQRIVAAEIRGVLSAGMLCSEAELGVGSDASGLLILPADATLGASVSSVLGLQDTVIDVAVTPNRGDCLSVLGLAREIAALTGQRLHRQRITVPEVGDATVDLISISVVDPELCGRYLGRVISDVRIAAAPPWMQYRLRAVGMRPINNVVDVTNFVMIERGQPLHAFDYDRLPRPEISVRRAGSDSSFTTLDGQERVLHPDDLLITSGGTPVAIAGVMGGADTEVTLSTRRILLESAWFAPHSVRRTARRLALRSEAAYRFERGTDIEGVVLAADRAIALMTHVSGGAAARGRADVYPAARPPAPVPLRLKRVDDLLGTSIGRAEVVSKLKALGMTVSPATRGTLTVVPPSYRADLSREIDLIEEIARLIGYDNISTTAPQCSLSGSGLSVVQQRQREVKRFLAAQGLTEVISMSFCAPRLNAVFPGLGNEQRPVTVLNPVTQEDSELRLSLCSGLVQVIRDNQNLGADGVAAFSVAKVFWRGERFEEGNRVAGVICRTFPCTGLGTKGSVSDFADLKGVVDALLDLLKVAEPRWRAAPGLAAFHPGKTALLEIAGKPIGIAGGLHPEIEEEIGIKGPCWLFEVDFDRLLQYCPPRIVYEDLPRFPAVVRDVAVVTEENFASDQIVRFVREWSAAGQLVEAVHLFDQYVGPPIPPGKKGLAFSIAYRARDRTLTDAAVNEMHAQLIAALREALHVEPR